MVYLVTFASGFEAAVDAPTRERAVTAAHDFRPGDDVRSVERDHNYDVADVRSPVYIGTIR